MKSRIYIFIATIAFLTLPLVQAEDITTLEAPIPSVSEIEKTKEEISRQAIILQALKERLANLESGNRNEKEFVINLIKGQAVLMGAEISLKEIKLSLEQRAAISTSYPIIIRADKETPYSSVVEILELCRTVGLSNVAFATPKE